MARREVLLKGLFNGLIFRPEGKIGQVVLHISAIPCSEVAPHFTFKRIHRLKDSTLLIVVHDVEVGYTVDVNAMESPCSQLRCHMIDFSAATPTFCLQVSDNDLFQTGDLVNLIQQICLEDGLLLLTCGADKNVIRFIAPLIVLEDQIDTAIEILSRAIAKAELKSKS